MITKRVAAAMFVSIPMFVAAPAGAQADGTPPARWNVAIVIHEGVELLDFAGPGEVFEAAANRDTRDGRPWFHVYTVAPTSDPLVSQDFLTIVPEHSIHDAPAPDILVVPGGSTGVLLRDEDFMRWVEASLADTEIALSVCTGAFVFADLGVLDGMEITTHWSALDALRRETTDATVRDDVRFVDNGAIVTSAGVSAGIDGALHVVARLLGHEHAGQTARYMQYEWTPTEEEVASYPAFNPQLDAAGRALQEAAALRDAGRTNDAVAAYRAVVSEHPSHAEAWYQLGLLLHTLGDLDAALPAHLEAAALGSGLTRSNALYNAACVHALQGRPDESVTFLHRAAEAGSRNARWADQDTDLASVRSHPGYADAMGRMWVNDARAQMGWNNDSVALDSIAEAAACGFDDFDSVLEDPAFARLRDSDRLRAIIDGGRSR